MGYGFSGGAVAAWRYFVLTNVVADALNGELPTMAERNFPGGARQGQPEERLARIRHMVLRGASEAEVPLAPDEVTVSADGNFVTVRVRHVYPVWQYHAQRITIPITVERSLAFP